MHTTALAAVALKHMQSKNACFHVVPTFMHFCIVIKKSIDLNIGYSSFQESVQKTHCRAGLASPFPANVGSVRRHQEEFRNEMCH